MAGFRGLGYITFRVWGLDGRVAGDVGHLAMVEALEDSAGVAGGFSMAGAERDEVVRGPDERLSVVEDRFLAGARVQDEDEELVGGEGGIPEERPEVKGYEGSGEVGATVSEAGLARQVGRHWSGCIRLAFIPEDGCARAYSFRMSGAWRWSAGSQVLSLSGYPLHLIRYWSRRFFP